MPLGVQPGGPVQNDPDPEGWRPKLPTHGNVPALTYR